MVCWGCTLKSIFKDHKNQTVNLSCRIEKDVYDVLNKEANEKGISLNSLVNSMAKKFIKWEIHSSDINSTRKIYSLIFMIFKN